MSGRDLNVWVDVYDCIAESIEFSSVRDALSDMLGNSCSLPDNAPQYAQDRRDEQIDAALAHMTGNIADALRHTRDAFIQMRDCRGDDA